MIPIINNLLLTSNQIIILQIFNKKLPILKIIKCLKKILDLWVLNSRSKINKLKSMDYLEESIFEKI
jgi:hypothetical protein